MKYAREIKQQTHWAKQQIQMNNKPKTLTTNPENVLCHKEIKQQTQDYNIKSNLDINLIPILQTQTGFKSLFRLHRQLDMKTLDLNVKILGWLPHIQVTNQQNYLIIANWRRC